MGKFISDEEMSKLEQQGVAKSSPAKKIISDEEMEAMEFQQKQSFLDKESPLGPSLRETGQTLHDGALGATQGIFANAADEIGAGIATGLDTAVEGITGLIPGTDANKLKQLEKEGFKMPEESLADKYKMYQEASQAEFNKAEERSPWFYGGGQIFGGIGTGIAAGAKLGINAASKAKPIMDIMKDQGKMKAGLELLKRSGTNYTKASPLIAMEGVTGSEGNLIGGTDEEQAQVGKDAISNLALGIPAILGMQSATDVAAPVAKKGIKKVGDFATRQVDKMAKTPIGRKFKKSWDYGVANINPSSEKELMSTELGRDGLLKQETNRADALIQHLMEGKTKVGSGVSESLENATERINIDDTFNNAFKEVAEDVDLIENISQTPNGRRIFTYLSNATSKGDLSAQEAKKILDNVDVYIDKFSSYTNPDVPTQDTLKYLQKFKNAFDQQLKESVPAYREAAQRNFDFNRSTIETILAGDMPADTADIFWGKLKKGDPKLLTQVRNYMRGIGIEGSSANRNKEGVENTIKAIKQFEQNDLNRLKAGTINEPALSISGQAFEDEILDVADGAAVRTAMQTVKDPRRAFKDGMVSGFFEMGSGGMYHGTRLAGKVANSAPVKKAVKSAGAKFRHVVNMPPEKLNEAADRMIQIKGLETLGKALKEGLKDGNQAKKNAALFSIMQNPNASLLFDENED